MNKHDQTNVSGIGTRPDFGMNMDSFVQMDIIFIEVKDRSQQSPTTNKPRLVKAIKYEGIVTTDLLVTLCEEQESLKEEQEERIHDLEKQLQDYEQEIYEKDQILHEAAEARPQMARGNCKVEEGYTGGKHE